MITLKKINWIKIATIAGIVMSFALITFFTQQVAAAPKVDTYSISANTVIVSGTEASIDGDASVDATGANANTIHVGIDWNEDQDSEVNLDDVEELADGIVSITCNGACTVNWGPVSHDYASAGPGTYTAFAVVYHGNIAGNDGISESQIVEFEITIEEDPVLGCMDSDADNYNENATEDDGSCIYPEVDTDEDGIPDDSDNCPLIANADQADTDEDGIGNVCDETPDGEPLVCDEGMHEEEGICVTDPLVCDEGMHEEEGVCVEDTIVCSEGTHEEEGVCVDDILVCDEGMHEEEGVCVDDTEDPLECSEGTHEEEGICVEDDIDTEDPIVCDQGTHEEEGVCVDDEISEEPVDENPPTNNNRRSGGRAPRGEVLGAFTTGEVLGATTCSPYLNSFIKIGKNNNPEEVRKLQLHLNEQLGIQLPVDGIFGPVTKKAVEDFQKKYSQDILLPWAPFGFPNTEKPSGYVYKMTKWFINKQVCPEDTTPAPLLP